MAAQWGERRSGKVTPLTPDEIWSEYVNKYLTKLSPVQRLWLFLLMLVETGHGKSIREHNWGNLASGGFTKERDVPWWSGPYWRPAWYDNTSLPTHKAMLEGKAPSAFRAYDSHLDGFAGYCDTLENRRYEPLLSAAAKDDAEAFVTALRETGYSPDYGAKHVATFANLRQAHAAKIPFEASPEPSPIVAHRAASGAGPLLLGLGLLTAVAVGWMLLRNGKAIAAR